MDESMYSECCGQVFAGNHLETFESVYMGQPSLKELGPLLNDANYLASQFMALSLSEWSK
jgi:hypothetical protein